MYWHASIISELHLERCCLIELVLSTSHRAQLSINLVWCLCHGIKVWLRDTHWCDHPWRWHLIEVTRSSDRTVVDWAVVWHRLYRNQMLDNWRLLQTLEALASIEDAYRINLCFALQKTLHHAHPLLSKLLVSLSLYSWVVFKTYLTQTLVFCISWSRIGRLCSRASKTFLRALLF